MAYMMFVDTSKCIGCKACQVACKAWHSLPTESTTFAGSYQNPPDLSENNLTIVHFRDEQADPGGNPLFLFFKNQCRHCMRPKCQQRCPKGVVRGADGIVQFTADCTLANVILARLPGELDDAYKARKIAAMQASCPFNIPRFSETLQRFVKCDFCYDRIGAGNKPACASTCPSGAIQFGTAAEIKAIASASLSRVKNRNPNAMLYNGQAGNTAWVYLLVAPPSYYGMREVSTIPYKTVSLGLRAQGMCGLVGGNDPNSKWCKY